MLTDADRRLLAAFKVPCPLSGQTARHSGGASLPCPLCGADCQPAGVWRPLARRCPVWTHVQVDTTDPDWARRKAEICGTCLGTGYVFDDTLTEGELLERLVMLGYEWDASSHERENSLGTKVTYRPSVYVYGHGREFDRSSANLRDAILAVWVQIVKAKQEVTA